jgi:hypothetical protein
VIGDTLGFVQIMPILVPLSALLMACF